MESKESNLPFVLPLGRGLAFETYQQKPRSIGWQGEDLKLRTQAAIKLDIEYSNQVWQCDHTRADIMVVDREEAPLGCPTLTTVIDLIDLYVQIVE